MRKMTIIRVLASCHALTLFLITSSGTRSSAPGFVFLPFNARAISKYNRCNNQNKNVFRPPFHQLAATNPSTPELSTTEWYHDTKPFVVVRHFAKQNVTDDEINTLLDDSRILSMQDLNFKVGRITPLIDEERFSPFCAAVLNSCNRYRDTAETVLGGYVAYDEKTILDNAYGTYSEDAVSVTPSNVGNRDYQFSLVSGPSGSGKTMFALRKLPLLIFPGDEKDILVLHFQAIMAFDPTSDAGIINFPDAIASKVQSMIAAKLSGKDLSNVTDIDLSLNVVIDEAGGAVY